ncbi:MAG: hypothetical protein CL472_02500 [Acidobacteria bacterium]|nr:hypothetical protein [Acidobacteriota bacterium]
MGKAERHPIKKVEGGIFVQFENLWMSASVMYARLERRKSIWIDVEGAQEGTDDTGSGEGGVGHLLVPEELFVFWHYT